MNQRQQVQPLRGPEQLQPQAHPVDTYYQPQAHPVQAPDVTGANNLLQLSKALGSLAPTLGTLTGYSIQHEKSKGMAIGEYLASKQNNMAGFNQAVKNGLIPAQSNPWVKVGYNQTKLENIGTAYAQELNTQWAGSDIKNTDDPVQFKQWLADRRSELVNSLGNSYSPAEIGAVLGKHVTQTEAALTAEHTNYRQKMTVENFKTEATQFAINNGNSYLQNLHTELLNADPKQAPVIAIQRQSEFAGVLTGKLKDLIAHGMNGTDANEKVVDGLFTLAKQTKNQDLMNVLDEVDTGSGKLGKTTYARQKATELGDYISAHEWQDLQHKELADKRANQQTADAVMSSVFPNLRTNPMMNIGPAVQSLTSIGHWEEAKALTDMQETFKKRQQEIIEDERLKGDMYEAAHKKTLTYGQIGSAVKSGKINGGTADSLMNVMNRKEPQDGSHSLVTSSLSTMKSEIGKTLKPTFGFEKDPSGAAQSAFMQDVTVWMSKHPDAEPADTLEYASKRKDFYLQLYGKSGQATLKSDTNKPKPTEAKPSQPKAQQAHQDHKPFVDAMKNAFTTGTLDKFFEQHHVPQDRRERFRKVLKDRYGNQ